MIDQATISELLNELEDEDDASTAKKGFSVLEGGKSDKSSADVRTEPPVGEDSKLRALVAALSPEEKAKLRTMLDEDDGGAPPGGE